MQPRYRIEDIGKLKTKYFTDREYYIKLFDKQFAALGREHYNTLMFYGVGGIGKSSLLEELTKRIDRLGAIWYKLDFANSCEVTRILIELRTSLGQKYKIQFPTFDLAYAVYWQKTHPETPLNRNSLTIVDDSEILMNILSYVGHFPILGLVPSIIKVIQGASRSLQEWWKKNGNADLMCLPEMPIHEIVKFLPAYLAKDLISYLESNSRTATFFIDTYEALLATERSDYEQATRDEWVRELISNLPGTLWVISGRKS